MVVADGESVTSGNVRYMKNVSGLSPLQYGGSRLKCALPNQAVPTEQRWRPGLLSSLLALRREKHRSQEDTRRLEAMLVSFCTT